MLKLLGSDYKSMDWDLLFRHREVWVNKHKAVISCCGRFSIPQTELIELSMRDKKKISSVIDNLPSTYDESDELVYEELQLMQAEGYKAEIESLSSTGEINFLTEKYIPFKIAERTATKPK